MGNDEWKSSDETTAKDEEEPSPPASDKNESQTYRFDDWALI